ncbi:MFS transporter [Mycobacterium camsae]|uniref:MFS transporter n=1 Tax=Mycobacterium gordonae TaxID=1778 RepID=UPI0024026E78|nr:MFS transporter [Mycobacterium gordonae]
MRSDPRSVVLACCGALVVVMSAVAGVNVALPDIALHQGASATDLTWIADAYTVALAALVLPAGAIGDDFGRRRTLLVGTLIFGLANALAAAASSPHTIIIARVIMGVGAAFIMPSTLSTITAVVHPDHKGRAVGIWAGFASAGSIMGLLLSGLLLEHYSWRSTFIGTAALAGVSLIATLVFVPNTKSAEEPAPDFPGAGLSAIGIGALVYGIIEGADRGWTHASVLASLIAAVAAITLFVFHELRTARPMLDPRLFTDGGFSSGTAALVIQFLGTFGFFFVGLQYIQLMLGYAPLKSSLAMLPMAAVVLPVSGIAPKLGQRFGNRIVIAAGLACMVAGFCLLARLDTASTYTDLLIGMLVFSGGLALSATPATNIIVDSLPPDKQGVASAMNDVTRELGAALGIAILGSLFSAGYRNHLKLPTAVPQHAADAIHESPAAGMHVAADPQLGALGSSVTDAVREAFVTGLAHAFTAGAAITGLTLVVMLFDAFLRRSRPRHRQARRLPAPPAPSWWLPLLRGRLRPVPNPTKQATP